MRKNVTEDWMDGFVNVESVKVGSAFKLLLPDSFASLIYAAYTDHHKQLKIITLIYKLLFVSKASHA